MRRENCFVERRVYRATDVCVYVCIVVGCGEGVYYRWVLLLE